MNRKRLSISLISIAILSCSTAINSSIVIQGDVKDGITSFSFPIQAFTTNYDNSVAYIGANEADHKEYALCRLAQNEIYVQAIAPQKINLNNTVGQSPNPLYNATISKLSFMNQEERLVVVTKELPESIFVLDKILNPDNIKLFGIRSVMDASGTLATKEIVALTSESFSYIFGAVKDNANNPFGQTGSNSGIAVMLRVNLVAAQTQNAKVGLGVFDQIDAQPGVPPIATAHRAALFDGTLPAIKIESNATILNGSVNLFFCNELKTLYIGTQAQAAAGATDGARSVITATIVNNKLIYKPIAPDSAFSAGTDNIIGTVGANAIVSNFKTMPMFTSTDLNYLIVAGGVEGAAATRRTVYALPLVFLSGNDANGTLAKKGSTPVDHFHEEEPYRINWRAFEEPAIAPADMFTPADPEVTIGNGSIQEGDITDIFVKNDAVFAIVSTPDPGYLSGIFYSRALFDNHGRIKGWTTWQRAFGSVTDAIFGAFVSFDTAACTYFTGASVSTINTIKRTSWNSGNNNGINPLATFVQQTFATADGGLRGMDEFPSTTPSLDGISLIIGTGSKKVLVAQTAYTTGGILTPLAGNTLAVDPLSFTGGAITTNFPAGNTNAIAITGGDLDTLNPVVTSAIAQANNNGWLFVGGIGGLAVLADDTGAGWTTLGNKFAGLQSGMSFKRIGDYSFIRKIMSDNTFLYVLSDTTFDRIDLAASNFATGQLTATTIATAEHLEAKSLLDFVVSDSFALVGTSNGLFRLSGSENIATIGTNATWQPVDLPEGLHCIAQLCAESPTNIPQDVARNHGGNIYVLDTDPGKNRAMVHRFNVSTSGGVVELTMLPDLFVKGYPSYFVEFDGMRNWIMPDGDFLYSQHNRTARNNPTLYVASSGLRSGARLVGNINPLIYITPQGEFFARMIRNSATGTLLLPTDQGLTSNE